MYTSPNVKETLRSCGLTNREQQIYLATLELGETLQLPLAKRIGMKRTSLRELLPSLLERGILQEIVRGKRRYLIARPPEELVSDLEKAAQQARASLPELVARQNTEGSKPRVFFFDGIEGVKQIYQRTLQEAQTIYSFVDVSRIHPKIQEWLEKEYTPARTKAQITALNLVNGSEQLEMTMPSDQYRKNKLISTDRFPFRMEILTFGRFVAYLHFQQTDAPSAVLIESQSAAETMRSIHKALWQQ